MKRRSFLQAGMYATSEAGVSHAAGAAHFFSPFGQDQGLAITDCLLPILRQSRQTTVLVGNGGNIYGPFDGLKCFDPDDIKVYVKPLGSDEFTLAQVTVSKVGELPFDYFTIAFAQTLPATTTYTVSSETHPDRLSRVVAGTGADAIALEVELSKIVVALQELRRDVERSTKVDFNGIPLTFDGNITDGRAIVKVGSRLKQGPDLARMVEDAVAQGSVPIFDSRDTAATYDLSPFSKVVINRWSYNSSVAPAAYEKVAQPANPEPSHEIKFQSADGAWWVFAEPELWVKQAGALGTGIANDEAAMMRARNHHEITGLALNFSAGIYAYTTSPNWAINHARIKAHGKVVLRHIGIGPAVLLDSGDYPAPGKVDVEIGPFIIEGGRKTTIGVYARAIHHSRLSFNIRGATAAAFHSQFMVCTTVNITVSGNQGAWSGGAAPSIGLVLSKRGDGEQTSYCLFLCPIVEHVGIGVEFTHALGNVFMGGTIEGCSVEGAHLYPGAVLNRLLAVDFELNSRDKKSGAFISGKDVVLEGEQNEIVHCDLDGTIEFAAGSKDNTMFGGTVNKINVSSGALRTSLVNVSYRRWFNGFLTDRGMKTRMRDLKNLTDGVMHDALPASIALEIGPSPWTWINDTANACLISIKGGDLIQFSFNHGSPDGVDEHSISAPAFAAPFLVPPGSGFTLGYADPPTKVTRHDF